MTRKSSRNVTEIGCRITQSRRNNSTREKERGDDDGREFLARFCLFRGAAIVNVKNKVAA